jgi:hypothetical protein
MPEQKEIDLSGFDETKVLSQQDYIWLEYQIRKEEGKLSETVVSLNKTILSLNKTIASLGKVITTVEAIKDEKCFESIKSKRFKSRFFYIAMTILVSVNIGFMVFVVFYYYETIAAILRFLE